jgi:glycosyltransferase involved in cell wall biosynthesis
LRLLFSSANNLLDPTSGAAISVRTLLRLLSEAGVECHSLTGSIYDRPSSNINSDNMADTGATPLDPVAPLSHLWLKRDGLVEHYIVPLAKPGRIQQSQQDDLAILDFAQGELDSFRPDILMIYGGGLYEHRLLRLAKERGIATVFYLANPTYMSRESLSSIDQIFTDTAATRDLYRQRLGLDPIAIGKFVDAPDRPAPTGPATFTTLVNPSAEKGVTLFYRIAELAQQTLPSIKFLVVESRSTLAKAEAVSGMRFSELRNIERVGIQHSMGAVFARTKVLLMPSLWHESGPRVPIEACSMGIPTVATDRGGIPEILGESGILISPPSPLIERHWLIPPTSAAIPWVEVLKVLYEDPAFYAEKQAEALVQWQAHDPARRVAYIKSILNALIERTNVQSRY